MDDKKMAQLMEDAYQEEQEMRLAELEEENRELKSENRRLESDLANERDAAGYWIARHESQDAITAWAMGFE